MEQSEGGTRSVDYFFLLIILLRDDEYDILS